MEFDNGYFRIVRIILIGLILGYYSDNIDVKDGFEIIELFYYYFKVYFLFYKI